MCGIIGILGRTPVAPLLVDALKHLEYRGYDSAGIATLEDGHLDRLRAEGKLRNLDLKLAGSPRFGLAGIGHTRWATHGAPTERNAHPHATERLAVVHNGIIENFRELRLEMEAAGRTFSSDTDTEVIAHLVTVNLAAGMAPREAVQAVLGRLTGAFSLAFLFEGEDNLLIGARRGSPLAVGWGDGEMFLGSDAIALGPFTDEITYLNDGDWVVLTRSSAEIYDEAGNPVSRPLTQLQGTTHVVDKGNHRHFMVKEVHEQPEVVGHTVAHYLDLVNGSSKVPAGIDFAAI
ncbi:MAG: glutamine--fructose-6-phosphate aminotransferase, partial [Rhizobiales bacterium]|nr:glutamine--fructose-6-phosphate aminotransferase [Hyphomicrobiales bacterium]